MYEKRYNPFAANVELVKGYLKSGKVLILGILHFLSLALTVVTMVLVPYDRSVSELMSAINSLGVNTSDFSSTFNSVLSNSHLPIVVSAVVSAIFTILTAIAFIVMFAKSRNSNPDSNPSSGASILRTLSMITFVCSIILAVIIVAGYVLFIIGISSVKDYFGGDAQQATITQVVIGIVVSLFLILFISYVSCQKNFYRSIKWSLNSVDLYRSGAAGYGVFNIIFAVFIGISLTVSAITVIKSFNISNLLVLISNLLSCLTAIMTAAFALGYNRYIKQAKYGMYVRMALILRLLESEKPAVLLHGTKRDDLCCVNPKCITAQEHYLPHQFTEIGGKTVCEFCEEAAVPSAIAR